MISTPITTSSSTMLKQIPPQYDVILLLNTNNSVKFLFIFTQLDFNNQLLKIEDGQVIKKYTLENGPISICTSSKYIYIFSANWLTRFDFDLGYVDSSLISPQRFPLTGQCHFGEPMQYLSKHPTFPQLSQVSKFNKNAQSSSTCDLALACSYYVVSDGTFFCPYEKLTFFGCKMLVTPTHKPTESNHWGSPIYIHYYNTSVDVSRDGHKTTYTLPFEVEYAQSIYKQPYWYSLVFSKNLIKFFFIRISDKSRRINHFVGRKPNIQFLSTNWSERSAMNCMG